LKNGYKRIYFDASDWPQYIMKTALFEHNGILECGAACGAENGCELFVGKVVNKRINRSLHPHLGNIFEFRKLDWFHVFS